MNSNSRGCQSLTSDYFVGWNMHKISVTHHICCSKQYTHIEFSSQQKQGTQHLFVSISEELDVKSGQVQALLEVTLFCWIYFAVLQF